MDKKTIKDIDVKGKKVFCRVDFNVPMDENQNITNDTRIRATLPTINYLLDNGAAVILACHVGRPTEARESKFSTKPIQARWPSSSEKMSNGLRTVWDRMRKKQRRI
jgi:phosphoglycerate kinase